MSYENVTSEGHTGFNGALNSLTRENENEQIKVSMLFCDIVNSTGLSIDLSPLQLRGLMLDYYSLTSEIMLSQGGTVAGYRGDGMLAVFGSESRSFTGCTANNAVAAGIELVDCIQQVQLDVPNCTALHVRMAVATGYVVPGQLSDSNGITTEMFGHTPFLAARLQTVAPTDSIVCSSETQSLIKSNYQTDFIGWKSLKGFRQETPVWEIAHRSM